MGAGPGSTWISAAPVAVAIFNDPSKMEFVALTGDSRFAQLQIGSIDVIARNAPWTMRRDTGYGASYVATSFFDGQAIMVPQSLGSCRPTSSTT
jgi:general L-amino acid transport system substrate-binding protein